MSAILMPSRNDTVILMVDPQDPIVARVPHADRVIAGLGILAEGAAILSLPLLVAELQGGGGLVEPVRRALQKAGDKSLPHASFSALADGEIGSRLATLGRGTLVLCGVETHTAVQQTALAALALGYRVHVAVDATGSRIADQAEHAERRLAHAGVMLESVEALLYQLLEKPTGDVADRVKRLLR